MMHLTMPIAHVHIHVDNNNQKLTKSQMFISALTTIHDNILRFYRKEKNSNVFFSLFVHSILATFNLNTFFPLLQLSKKVIFFFFLRCCHFYSVQIFIVVIKLIGSSITIHNDTTFYSTLVVYLCIHIACLSVCVCVCVFRFTLFFLLLHLVCCQF